MLINLQLSKIAHVMSLDKRDIFHRLAKILEEQGELTKAILLQDKSEIIEETIDNLMVLTSIAYVVDERSMTEAQDIVNSIFHKNIYNKDQVITLWMKYHVDLGEMSNAVQKNQKIGASAYKGFATDKEVIKLVMNAITHITAFLSFQTSDVELLNEIIVKKNAKWHAKTLDGMQTNAA